MRLVFRTAAGLTYAALVAFYGAFIVLGIVFLWHGLAG
jgi:hypothetical protein